MENNRFKFRIKFKKIDRLRFIGHLDLLSLFHRALKRARLPVAYSRGFNPHQETSFALPLSLGYYGLGEIIDIIFTEKIMPEEIMLKLNEAMPGGIEILSAKLLQPEEKTAASIVSAANYTVLLPESLTISQNALNSFIEQNEIRIIKKTKKSTKEIDIKPLIYTFSPEMENQPAINMLIAAGTENSIRADNVVEALFEYCQLEYKFYSITYKRNAMYKLEKGKFCEL